MLRVLAVFLLCACLAGIATAACIFNGALLVPTTRTIYLAVFLTVTCFFGILLSIHAIVEDK